MKNIFSKTAFTLIELLVSILLVSFIVLGIVVISIVLSNNGQDYGQRYLVRSATQTTLNNILNNASLAVGSAISNDEAILLGGIGHPLTDADTFCIHQCGTSHTPEPCQNAVNSGSDIWLCYSWTDSPPNYEINWCAETYTGNDSAPGSVPDPRGAMSCSSAQSGGDLISGTSVSFLGTAASNPVTGSSFSYSGGQYLFSTTIQNCLNNATGPGDSCNGDGSGVSSDPEDNPEVQLSGSVIPLQASGD